jgi:integrase
MSIRLIIWSLRIARTPLGLVGRATNEIGRATWGQLNRLITAFGANPRQQIPLGRMIPFTVATAVRQDEIGRIGWTDFDLQKMILITIARTRGGSRETISVFLYWVSAAIMRVTSWRTSASLRAAFD